jgi:hypothetical protein
MKPQSIRHYRVVQRKKGTDANHPINNMPVLCEELRKLACIGIMMYIISILLSFITGLILGNNR